MNEPTKGTDPRDRRQHVRVRPAADFEVRVDLQRHGQRVHVPVVDLSIGGFGLLLTTALADCVIGESLDLEVTTPLGDPFLAQAVVRHFSESKGVCGVEFSDARPEATQLLRRCISELLARGNLA